MTPTMYLAIIAVVVILLIAILKSSVRPPNFPPGPIGFPLVGYLPFLDVPNLGRSFQRISKRYGDIFSIMVGTKPLVVLNSWPLIKEAMAKKELAGRPSIFSGTFFQKGKTGICTTEGKTWEQHREFFHQQMRNFLEEGGKGTQGFIEVIMDEIDDIRIDLAKKIGEPIGLAYRLNVSLINILWTIASGRRLHAQQQEFLSVYECIDKINGFMSRAAIMSFLPLLSRIVPESISKMEKGRYYRNRFVAISEKWIKEHKEDYRGNRTGDLQDAYLEKVKEGCEGFSENGLSAMLRELFVIGAESESVMLRWAFRVLSVNKDAQRQIQDEMDRVVGERDVTWEDRKSLHYTMAAISELQRYSDIAPSGIPHKAMCDVEFHGFTIPKDTIILTNLHACHRNPTYWKYPDKFEPEHFLDESGNYVSDKEGFVPFGTGLRSCPAAGLTNMQMFLMITNLLKTFSFRVPPGDGGHVGTYYEAGTGFLRNPKPFYVVIYNRK